MSSYLSKITTASLAAVVLVATAADAFAIRNRYTNEQNEGFTGLLVEGFAPFYSESQPLYRPYRRGPAYAAGFEGRASRYGGPQAPDAY